MSRDEPVHDVPSSGCPDAGVLAAFFEATLPEPARAEVLAHAGACVRCQGVLGALDRMSGRPAPVVPPSLLEAARDRQAGSRRRRAWRWSVAGAAVAASVLMAVALYRAPEPPPASGGVAPDTAGSTVDDVRAGAGREAPVLLAPEAGQQVGDGAPVTFRWAAVKGAIQYRVQVLNADGEVAWSAVTGATSVEFRQRLDDAGPYYTWVSAELPDGRRVPSPVVRLTGR